MHVGAGSGSGSKKSKGDVVELTDSNFDKEVLESKDLVLVEFFAPWCVNINYALFQISMHVSTSPWLRWHCGVPAGMATNWRVFVGAAIASAWSRSGPRLPRSSRASLRLRHWMRLNTRRWLASTASRAIRPSRSLAVWDQWMSPRPMADLMVICILEA